MKIKIVSAMLAAMSVVAFAAPGVASAAPAANPPLVHISIGNTAGPGCTPINLVLLKLYLCL